MSSRAFRRLQQDAEVIRIRGVPGEGDQEDEQETPGFGSQSGGRRKKAGNNLFALLGEDDGGGSPSDQEEDQQNDVAAAPEPLATQSSKQTKRKKKKKKTKSTDEKVDKPEEGTDDVDTAIKEVNELLGEIPAGDQSVAGAAMATLHRSLLTIDRRFLNADNEMRRIFGSRVVHAEEGRRRTHQRTYHRSTVLATPKDSWPKMDKPGLSMQLAECKDGCQCFVFEHSVTYQRIQFRFWDAVETFDPNAIGAVLHAHPYHIDSLLQLSEVCKMSEDVQMAADLIERALYCFECTFHALFNYTQGNCRLSFSRAENRPFFLALFRHLYYIGRRGCHRTALEFCKFLLSLDPEGDPLCVLLMIDYYALRAGEYHFILNLFREWESHRNLSQLPNFAFSVPLALFHSSQCEGGEGERGDEKLQEALIMFPSLLHPLLDKCSVTVDTAVMKHSFFNHTLSRDPEALQLLIKLYIERSHSLWKEAEVLTWLEANARRVIARADSRDPLIDDCVKKRQKRYVGTPRNIYRHVIISDIEQAAAALPRELANSPIMMYDPLPPLDSIAGYSRPERTHTGLREDENPLILFLRSLLPNFNPQGEGPGDLRQRRQMVRPPPQEEGGPEGAVGGPLNLQPMLERLSEALQGLIDELRPPGHQEGEGEQESSDEGNG